MEQQSSLMAEPIIKIEPTLEGQPDTEAEYGLEPKTDTECVPDFESELNIKSEHNIAREPIFESESNIKVELDARLEPCTTQSHSIDSLAKEQHNKANYKSNAGPDALGIRISTSDAEKSTIEDIDLEELAGHTDYSPRSHINHADTKRRRMVFGPVLGYCSWHDDCSKGSTRSEATSTSCDRYNVSRHVSTATEGTFMSYNSYDEFRHDRAENQTNSGSDSYIHPSRRQNFKVQGLPELSAIEKWENQLASSEFKRGKFGTGANAKPLGNGKVEDRPFHHNYSRAQPTTANRVMFSNDQPITSGGKLMFVLDKSEIKRLRRMFKTTRKALTKLDSPYDNLRQALSDIGNGVDQMTANEALDIRGLSSFKSRYSALDKNLGEVIAFLKRIPECFDQELAILQADLLGAQPLNEKNLQQMVAQGGKRKFDELDYGIGS